MVRHITHAFNGTVELVACVVAVAHVHIDVPTIECLLNLCKPREYYAKRGFRPCRFPNKRQQNLKSKHLVVLEVKCYGPQDDD